MLVARVALALVAVVVIAWTAVLWNDLNTGYEAVAKQDTEGLKRAQRLDPSRYWDRVLAGMYLVKGDPGAAVAEAEKIVRAEPQNLAAWVVIYRASLRTDPRRAQEAADQIRRLDPEGTRGS